MSRREKAVVVGGGPAGVAAAIQMLRAAIDPLLIERGRIGGLVLNAHKVENYLGFPSGISGPELAVLFREHLTGAQVRTLTQEVLKVSLSGGLYQIKTNQETLAASAVVVASGTTPRTLPADLLADCDPGSVFYEVSDVPAARRDMVAIIGGGDAAFDYALGLAEKGAMVDVFFRSIEPKALPILIDRARQTRLVDMHAETEIVRVSNCNGGIELFSADQQRWEADALIGAVGRDPNLAFLDEKILNHVRRNELDNLPGLFLAGDVQRGDCRQVAIATGDGVVAAMRVAEFLRKTESARKKSAHHTV